MSGPRRELAYAVLLCLAGAGLALFAATRTWAVEVTPRPAPLADLRTARSGADVAPWLPGLAVVGLAGAGALLATRARLRAGVGVLIVACGAGVLAGAGPAVAGGAAARWPALCGLGGAALVAGGVLTVLRGRRWPALGARYERRAPRPGPAAESPAGAAGAVNTVAVWEALDRGEDPTDPTGP